MVNCNVTSSLTFINKPHLVKELSEFSITLRIISSELILKRCQTSMQKTALQKKKCLGTPSVITKNNLTL